MGEPGAGCAARWDRMEVVVVAVPQCRVGQVLGMAVHHGREREWVPGKTVPHSGAGWGLKGGCAPPWCRDGTHTQGGQGAGMLLPIAILGLGWGLRPPIHGARPPICGVGVGLSPPMHGAGFPLWG